MSLYLVKFSFTKPALGQYEPLVRIVTFTLLQLLQHNIQLGAASQFSILSSHWFIYGCRQHFIVINLSQTVVNYRQLLNAVRAVASSRRHLLFVNERAHATSIVSDLAKSIGEAYAIGRWVGGAITNFRKIWLMYHYKLKHKDNRELTRFKYVLKSALCGMNLLKSLPTLIFFNSVMHSYSATQEAHAMSIAAGGVTDTDALPDALLYPIPGNDDSFVSLYFLNKLIAKTVILGKIYAMNTTYQSFCESRATSIWYSVKKRLRRARRRLSFLFRLRRKEFGKMRDDRHNVRNRSGRYTRYSRRKFVPTYRKLKGWSHRASMIAMYLAQAKRKIAESNRKHVKLSKAMERRKISRFKKIRARTRLVSKSYANVVKNYRVFLSSRFSDIGKNKQSLKFYFKNIVKYKPAEFLQNYRYTIIKARLAAEEIYLGAVWTFIGLYAARCLYLLEGPWELYERMSNFIHSKEITVLQYYAMLFPAVNILNRILYILRRCLFIHFFRRTVSPLNIMYTKDYEELTEECERDVIISRKIKILTFSNKLFLWKFSLYKQYTFLDHLYALLDEERFTFKQALNLVCRTNRPLKRTTREIMLIEKFVKKVFYDRNAYALNTAWEQEGWYAWVIDRLLRWPDGAENLFYVLHLKFFRKYVLIKCVLFNFLAKLLKKKYCFNKKFLTFLLARKKQYFDVLKLLLFLTRKVLHKLS